VKASKTQRTRACSTYDARRRLAQSKKYVEVAELLLGEDAAEAKTVATGNAVLAGIAAADAICCTTPGERSRSQDHRQAAD
jgi:hypothetical protein